MTFIVAEAGVNHCGDMSLAYKLIESAKDCGANAVKFQLFDPEKLEPPGARRDMLACLQLTQDQHRDLKAHCDEAGIAYYCTPFDVDSCRFLIDLGLKQIKIGSGNLENLALLKAASDAHTVILSTGAARIQEIRRAVRFIHDQPRPHGGGMIVLHCVSAYPAPPKDMNLRVMHALREHLPHCTVGLSDHTAGIHIPIAATAMGAAMIEKHLTLDRAMDGPDHAASLNPDEFKAMVQGIRDVEAALGDGQKRAMPSEKPVQEVLAARQAHREIQEAAAQQAAAEAEKVVRAAAAHNPA